MSSRGSDRDLNALLSEFESIHPSEGRALRAMLGNTPSLRSDVARAIDNGQLSAFEPHSSPYGGSYNPDTGILRVPMGALAAANMASPRDSHANMARVVFGHEISHALHRDEISQNQERFLMQIDTIARSASPHEYTAVLQSHSHKQRTREALDEIAGVNALATFIRDKNPTATLEHLYRALPEEMRSYIDRNEVDGRRVYTPKPGLTFSDDLRIDPGNPANVEAMGKLFFDARDYPHRYGQRSLAQIGMAEDKAQRENPDRPLPTVYADLAAAGIDARRLDPSTLPAGFVDGRAPEPTMRREPSADAPTAEARASIDPALIGKVRNAVARTETTMGKPWDEHSERLAASLSVLADRKDFRPTDDILVSFNFPVPGRASGEYVFVHRQGAGASSDPYANRAGMDTQQALARPAQETFDAWALEKSNTQQEQMQTQQAHSQQLSQDHEARQRSLLGH